MEIEKMNNLFGHLDAELLKNMNASVVNNLVESLAMFLNNAEHLYDDMRNKEHEVSQEDLDATRMLIKRAGELYLVLCNN